MIVERQVGVLVVFICVIFFGHAVQGTGLPDVPVVERLEADTTI